MRDAERQLKKLWEIGEPCAVKVARTVRRGGVGKGVCRETTCRRQKGQSKKHYLAGFLLYADTVMLCPPCHGRFDGQFRRKKEVKRVAPVGLVVVWVWHKGKPCLAAEARWFYDLFEVIASFAAGMQFEVQAEILMSRVGSGMYVREDDGVRVLREVGACTSFGLLLQDVLQGVVG